MRWGHSFIGLMQKSVRLESVDLNGLISKIYYKDPLKFRSNVIATASNYQNSYSPYYALDPTTGVNQRWISEMREGKEKYIVQLKRIKYKLKSYKILSENSAAGQSHLKSWTFSCSLDGKNWDVLHSMSNSQDLNGPSRQKEYPVSSNKFYSFFKIEATGDSWETHDQYNKMISMQQIDIITTIVVRDLITNSIMMIDRMIKQIFLLIVVCTS